MRILVLSHLFPNNVRDTQGLFVLERVRHMAKGAGADVKAVGAEVRVIAPIAWFPFPAIFGRYAANRNVRRRIDYGNLQVLHPRFWILPGFHVCSALFLAAALLADAECRRRIREAEVLDVHWTFPDAFAAALLGALFGKPFTVTLRGHEAFYEGQGRLRAALIRVCIRRAAGVIAVSEELRLKAIRLAGVPASRTRTVANGIDVGKFRPLDRAEARAKLALPAEALLLLSVGRLSPGKGFHLLVEALPEVIRAHPSARLIIVGEADPEGGAAYQARLEECARALGLADRVLFAGKILPSDLILWYSACDCFCLASSSEGCPNVVLEALACGRPVAARAVGGIIDMLGDDKMGILASADGADMPERIVETLSKTWDSAYISGQMRERDWDWCGRRALAALGEFMGPAPAGSERDA